MKKKQNKKIIISVLISIIMLFAVFSAPATAFAAEEERQNIIVYDIFGDNYVSSDYLKDLGLYGFYFKNPEVNATADYIYNLSGSSINNEYVDILALGGPLGDNYIPYFITGEIFTENNSVLLIYDMGEYIIETNVSESDYVKINNYTFFVFINDYEGTLDLNFLYNYQGKIAPGQPGFDTQSTYYFLETLNFYRGISENLGVTDLYPVAENFVANGEIYNTFIVNNLTIFDSDYSFDNFPGDYRALVFGNISDYTPEIISDNSNESMFFAEGFYLWNNILDDLDEELILNSNLSDFSELNFYSNGKNFQAFFSDQNIFYLNFQNQNIIAYNNGWVIEPYKFISFTNNNIIDLNNFYTNGTTSGLYLRNNMQQLLKADNLFGEFNIIEAPTFIENVYNGISGFFGAIGEVIISVFEGMGNLFFGSINLAGQIIDNIGGIFSDFNNFIRNVTSNPLPWFALLAIVGIVILIIYIIFNRRNK